MRTYVYCVVKQYTCGSHGWFYLQYVIYLLASEFTNCPNSRPHSLCLSLSLSLSLWLMIFNKRSDLLLPVHGTLNLQKKLDKTLKQIKPQQWQQWNNKNYFSSCWMGNIAIKILKPFVIYHAFYVCTAIKMNTKIDHLIEGHGKVNFLNIILMCTDVSPSIYNGNVLSRAYFLHGLCLCYFSTCVSLLYYSAIWAS